MNLQSHDFKVQEVDFFSKGLRIHGRYFKAEGPSRGNFLLLHGLTSNSAWFGNVAQNLAEQGYNVLIYDRRGSGQSAGIRGDVPGKDAFFWDMKAATDYIWSQSLQPLHIMAFSYSWKLPPIFIKKLEKESKKVASLIFVAPASDLKTDLQPKLSDKLKVFLNWKGPYFDSPVKDTDLTQEKETLKWIRHQSESRPQLRFTRRFLMTSNSLDQEASSLLSEIEKPMLVLVPKDDKVIDQEKVRERFSQGPLGITRQVLDVDGGHLMDNPEAQAELINRVLKWVAKPFTLNAMKPTSTLH